MQRILNGFFGSLSLLGFVVWSAVHLATFFGYQVDSLSFWQVLSATSLIIITIGYLEYGFRLTDGSRPGTERLATFRGLPRSAKLLAALLFIYSAGLIVISYFLELSKGNTDAGTIAFVVETTLREYLHANTKGGYESALIILGLTALIAHMHFLYGMFLVAGDHAPRPENWIDHAAAYFVPVALVMAGASYVLYESDYCSAAVGVAAGMAWACYLWWRRNSSFAA